MLLVPRGRAREDLWQRLWTRRGALANRQTWQGLCKLNDIVHKIYQDIIRSYQLNISILKYYPSSNVPRDIRRPRKTPTWHRPLLSVHPGSGARSHRSASWPGQCRMCICSTPKKGYLSRIQLIGEPIHWHKDCSCLIETCRGLDSISRFM